MNLKNSSIEERIAALEALLFSYGEPMAEKKLATMLEISEEEVGKIIMELEEKLKEGARGLTLLRIGNEVQLGTKSWLKSLMEKLVKDEFKENLTPAAAETLSIVAYGGPIGRNAIDYIRGVNSTFTLRALLLRGLIDRAPDPERMNSYKYTASFDFLKHIGLSKKEDLPDYPKFQELIKRFSA